MTSIPDINHFSYPDIALLQKKKIKYIIWIQLLSILIQEQIIPLGSKDNLVDPLFKSPSEQILPQERIKNKLQKNKKSRSYYHQLWFICRMVLVKGFKVSNLICNATSHEMMRQTWL